MNMPITANDTDRKSWLEVPENSGIFQYKTFRLGYFTKENVVTVELGLVITQYRGFTTINYFHGIELTDDMFMQDTLKRFYSDGQKTWRLVSKSYREIFDIDNSKMRLNKTQRYHLF
jgi:fumarylacetoacetase